MRLRLRIKKLRLRNILKKLEIPMNEDVYRSQGYMLKNMNMVPGSLSKEGGWYAFFFLDVDENKMLRFFFELKKQNVEITIWSL